MAPTVGEMVEPLAERLMSEYLAGQYDACRVVYMKFVSNSKQVPETMQLLPMRVPAAQAFLSILSCVSITPLGYEVVPEVY